MLGKASLLSCWGVTKENDDFTGGLFYYRSVPFSISFENNQFSTVSL